MKQLFITRAAEADLLEIWAYLFEKSEQAADRTTDEITRHYDLLCEFPSIGRRRPECGADYRSLAVGNYVIFYKVTRDKLEISRILYGSRDFTGIFAPDDEEP